MDFPSIFESSDRSKVSRTAYHCEETQLLDLKQHIYNQSLTQILCQDFLAV